jgi:hypothetical protein
MLLALMSTLESRQWRFSIVRAAVAGLGAAFYLCVTSVASGQAIDDASRTAARAMGTSGVEAYQAGNYQEASDRLEKAYAIARVPSLGLWSARTLTKLGKLVEAADRYLETVSLQIPEGDYDIQKQAQTDATRELKELKSRIPTLNIQVKGANAAEVSVSVDGTPLSANLVSEPRLVNPGEHKVEGTYGTERANATVSAVEGKSVAAVLEFHGTSSAGDSVESDSGSGGGGPYRMLGFIALGVGGAGIITGSVAGVLAIDKKSTIDKSASCEDNRCNDRSLVDSYGTLRTVSSVGLIAGAIVAGSGLALILASGSSEKEPSAAAYIGPGTVGVRGRF